MCNAKERCHQHKCAIGTARWLKPLSAVPKYLLQILLKNRQKLNIMKHWSEDKNPDASVYKAILFSFLVGFSDSGF